MNKQGKASKELIIYLAALMAIGAMSIDTVLPALSLISHDLNINPIGKRQFLISGFFFSFSFSQLFYGPLSDSFGRKKMLYAGLMIYLIGSAVSIVSKDFETLLLSRILQGLGCGSLRIMTFAIARDSYEGRDLASKLSVIMSIFIIVPIIAPNIGDFILRLFGNWRVIFILFTIVVFGMILWTFFRFEETLKPEYKRPLSIDSLASAFKMVITTPDTLIYSTASGLLIGSFIFYLSSSELIFKEIYHKEKAFSIIFACLAFFSGFGNFCNSRLVHRLGIHRITHIAVTMAVVITFLMLGFTLIFNSHLPFFIFVLLLGAYIFFYALSVTNFNSIALYPLPQVAGSASTFIGFYSGMLASVISLSAGSFYSQTLLPYTILFFTNAVLAFFIILSLEGKNMYKAREPETLIKANPKNSKP